MREMVSIVHNKYRRITDVVLRLDYPLVLKFSVDLFRIRPANNGTGGVEKPNYYAEYEYSSDGERKITVMRMFGYFLEIAPSKSKSSSGRNSNNLSAIITPDVLYYVKRRITEVLNKWFIGDSANETFGMRNGNYVVRSSIDPIKVATAYNTYIEFEPCIGQDRRGEQILGVRMYINSDDNSYFVSAGNLFMLYDFLSTFNMYIAAQNMLSYMGKPRYGTNHSDLGTTNTKPKSFFSN
jgi:hypothetical protein